MTATMVLCSYDKESQDIDNHCITLPHRVQEYLHCRKFSCIAIKESFSGSHLREVPMVARNDRLEANGKSLIDHVQVMVEARLVDGAIAVGIDAGP